MGKPNDDIDIRTEMAIALFWRGIIGDYEYGRFNPEDMLRWYFALELRGPEEIRDYLHERYIGRPNGTDGVMYGVVSAAPHPPLWIIRNWLEYHETKTRAAMPFAFSCGFVVLALIFFPSLHGCASLTPVNPLVMRPPNGTPQTASYSPGFGPSTLPGGTPTAAAPSGFNPNSNGTPSPVPTATGAHSGGIAGAASGATSPNGVTGPTSSGLASGR